MRPLAAHFFVGGGEDVGFDDFGSLFFVDFAFFRFSRGCGGAGARDHGRGLDLGGCHAGCGCDRGSRGGRSGARPAGVGSGGGSGKGGAGLSGVDSGLLASGEEQGGGEKEEFGGGFHFLGFSVVEGLLHDRARMDDFFQDELDFLIGTAGWGIVTRRCDIAHGADAGFRKSAVVFLILDGGLRSAANGFSF